MARKYKPSTHKIGHSRLPGKYTRCWQRTYAILLCALMLTVLRRLCCCLPSSSRRLQWWSEALHGVAFSPGVDFTHGPIPSATCFPEPISIASAFDRKLIWDVATVVSTEARAMNNVGQAGMTFFTPNINIFRDPRWGRGQETPGEDPYLTSQYVYQLITGLQGGIDPRYLKIIADCKHFAAYDVENWEGNERYGFDARVSDQDMVESFLPSFETCVRDARVASIMCSYNAVNGVPSCANSYLLHDLARSEWNLQGFVVSDCDAVENIFKPHQYTQSWSETVAVALKAGTDNNCGTTMQTYAADALKDGSIAESDIDTALIRSIGTLIRSGWFDPAEMQPYRQIPPSAVNTAQSQKFALQAARAGIVMLKNGPRQDAEERESAVTATAAAAGAAPTLPFSNLDAPTLALIGPFANSTHIYLANYYGQAPPFPSALGAFESAGWKVLFAEGCSVTGNDTSGFSAALAVVKQADLVLYLGGIDESIEAESLDRVSIALPEIQTALLNALIGEVSATKQPFVAGFFSGGPLDLSSLFDSPSVGGVLWLGYGGQAGSKALVDIVGGHVSPAGRTVTTMYPASYVDQGQWNTSSTQPQITSPSRRFGPLAHPLFLFSCGLLSSLFLLSCPPLSCSEHD